MAAIGAQRSKGMHFSQRAALQLKALDHDTVGLR
jgi:hypothetical protein